MRLEPEMGLTATCSPAPRSVLLFELLASRGVDLLLDPLQRAGGAVWRALDAQGRSKARITLLDMSERCAQTDPERAQRLREAAAYLERQS